MKLGYIAIKSKIQHIFVDVEVYNPWYRFELLQTCSKPSLIFIPLHNFYNDTMSINIKLNVRCAGTCELCDKFPAIHEFTVSPATDDKIENQVAICDSCLNAMNETDKGNYWRCLEGSIWNPEPSVQALSYRILQNYKGEEWASGILSSVDLDENTEKWAMSFFEITPVHKDAFGNILENGDNVVLTQALNVKGTSFSAAKGTIVKKIKLVSDNTEQIEGKINEQTIVILCKFVKKG